MYMNERVNNLKSDVHVLYYHNITPENINEHMKEEGVRELEESAKIVGFASLKDAYYTIISKHLFLKSQPL